MVQLLKEKNVEAYTTEEVQRIFAALENKPLKWQALLRLLIDTGIRRGECCGLRWQDFDFKANTITIAGNLCYTPAKRYLFGHSQEWQCTYD